ncbi:hypothetical protein [Ohtaekwangia sp.]
MAKRLLLIIYLLLQLIIGVRAQVNATDRNEIENALIRKSIDTAIVNKV